MGLRGHPVAQAYERLAAAIFETAYLSAARIGRRPFTSAEPMKIASFNINNINLRLTNLLNWLREAEPDIVCCKRPGPGHRVPRGGTSAGGLSCGMPR